jgi:urease accessory protein
MDQDAKKMRDTGPTIFTSVKQGTGVEEVIDMILAAWKAAGSPGKPGPVTA